MLILYSLTGSALDQDPVPDQYPGPCLGVDHHPDPGPHAQDLGQDLEVAAGSFLLAVMSLLMPLV